MGKVDVDPDVGAVVVGFDRWINYYKIQYAQLCINEIPGCQVTRTLLVVADVLFLLVLFRVVSRRRHTVIVVAISDDVVVLLLSALLFC